MMVGAIFEKCFLEGGVCEVGAIPSEEVVDPMDDGEGQVGGVQLCFGWELQKLDDGLRERKNLRQDFKLRDARHYFHPFCGSRGIALGDFRPHGDGGVKAEADPFMIPPILRELLMGCHRFPSHLTSREVAGNGGLDVNGFHVLDRAKLLCSQSQIIDISLSAA